MLTLLLEVERVNDALSNCFLEQQKWVTAVDEGAGIATLIERTSGVGLVRH